MAQTKTQKIANGLRALGWVEDRGGLAIKGTKWKGGTLPGREMTDVDRIFTSDAGSARWSRTGKKTDSFSIGPGWLNQIIKAGE